jgi:hypothetical protein
MRHENTLEWLTNAEYREVRKLLPHGKIQVCKYLIGISRDLGISREVFGLREAKDFADSLSEWREPVFDLLDHIEELEKMENETKHVIRLAFPDFSDEHIEKMLNDREYLKRIASNQETGFSYGI